MKKNKNLIYIVEVIVRNDKAGQLLAETVGIYDSLILAEEYRKKCEDNLLEEETDYILYDVRTFVLNGIPEILNPQQREAEELTLRQLSSGLNVQGIEPDVFERAIIEMMQKGFVDQLIGDDGEFYYQLTDKGKKVGKELFIEDLKKELEEEDKEEDWQEFRNREWEDDDEDDNINWSNFL